MRILLLTDQYLPQRSSCAVQMRDLAEEFASQGHEPIILVPDENLESIWRMDEVGGVKVYRLLSPKIINVSYLRRAVNEILLPVYMMRAIKKIDFLGSVLTSL